MGEGRGGEEGKGRRVGGEKRERGRGGMRGGRGLRVHVCTHGSLALTPIISHYTRRKTFISRI